MSQKTTLQKGHTSWTQNYWLRAICVVVAITLPLALALRGAWTLSMSAIGQQGEETERVKTQEIRSESRSLGDEISAEIETIQLRALATYLIGKFEPGIANSSLQAVAVLSTPGNSQALAKQFEIASVISSTPGPIGPVETQDLSNAAHAVVLKDIQTSGVSIVSLSSRAGQNLDGAQLVGLGFSAPNGKVLMAVVDPSQAFSGVTKWAMGREGEMLRGYVVSSTGRVLIHTEKAYNGSDFSNNTFFKQALQPTLHGERVGGTGIFAAADTLKARISYSQLRTLPFVVVAERVVRSNSTTLMKRLAGPAVLMASVLFLAALVSIVLLLRVFSQRDAEIQTLTRNRKTESEVEDEAFDEMLDDMLESPQTTKQVQIPLEIAAIDRTKVNSHVQVKVKSNELPS
jgi:hypothetical protein